MLLTGAKKKEICNLAYYDESLTAINFFVNHSSPVPGCLEEEENVEKENVAQSKKTKQNNTWHMK